MSESEKKQINGGIGPMMLWVIIMGVTMGINTLVNTIKTFSESDEQSSGQKKNQYSASKSKSGYIRMSAFPSRSNIMMPL
ncbi:MAG: hypothetical protein LBF00_01465 [Mycoplasmataceae bacterium]|nr:hypothetical protein [Mycoplasmataceae bacterium]